MKRAEARTRKRIRDLMLKQGRKWEWLAAETGYSRSHVTAMMSGEYELSPRFLKLAAIALGQSEGELTAA